MVDIEFNYNQRITVVQAKLDEPFQNIIKHYLQKSSLQPGSVYFLANGNQIKNPQSENYNNGLQNNIQSRTAYGSFNFQPQQNTQMYQYQKLNNQGNVPLQVNNNQQVFARQAEMV